MESFGYTLRSGLSWAHCGSFCSFWETTSLISILATLVYISTESKNSSFPTLLPAFVAICFIDHGHYDWDEREPQSSFNLHFPAVWWCWTLLKMFISHFFFFFFFKNSVWFHGPFLKLVCFLNISYLSSLYILNTTPLLVI